jgi:hydrogenase maturation factor HypF (carbamoyltransferase family)
VSGAQVSRRAHITLDVETERDATELVRCLTCRAVYGKPLEQAHAADAAACPECGALGWLALNIPVHETALALPA